ncbi:hypothetical protein WA158_003735 [Blastocystis sp. Blastoise]
MNSEAIECIKLSTQFFNINDVFTLRGVCKDLYNWSNETNTHIYSLINGGIKPEQLTQFWEFCLGIDKLNYHYFVMYDKFKGYGINRDVIESEGVYGEISRDIGRTFPLHALFREERGIGQQMLENVLEATAEYVNSIGYCQGMNFVAGALLICEIDPAIKQFASSQQGSIELMQRTIVTSQTNIEKRVFRLFVYIINTLQMTRLWSVGIPGLKLYTYILDYYAKVYVPELCAHFEDIGFDLSIFVTKWFLTLFAYNLPFSILFKVWSFIFLEKWPGIFRVSIALLIYIQKYIQTLDLVDTSKYLQNIKQSLFQDNNSINEIFKITLSLSMITPEDLEKIEVEFNYKELNRLRKENISQQTKHIQDLLRAQEQVDKDIHILRQKLESLSNNEYPLKNQFYTYLHSYESMDIERSELYQRKELLRKQVEEIMSYENTYVSYPSVDIRKTITESYIRQNDISYICKKINLINEQISQLESQIQTYKVFVEDSQANWEELLERKASLKAQLLELVKEKQSLLLCN